MEPFLSPIKFNVYLWNREQDKSNPVFTFKVLAAKNAQTC